MDEELRLWAVNVDVFRQCFAAPSELADTLREVTNSVTPSAPEVRSGLLSKLGPLMRNPPQAPRIRPGVPNNLDGEAMMTSRYIDTDRLSACWVLAQAWLDHLALAHTRIPLPMAQFEELEFDLVRTGISTQVSIRQLWRHTIDIPLRATDSMTIGYMEYPVVLRLIEEWESAVEEMEEGTAQFATHLLQFTRAYPDFAEQAAANNAPPPDMIAWWTSR